MVNNTVEPISTASHSTQNSSQTKTGQHFSHPYFKDKSLNTNGNQIKTGLHFFPTDSKPTASQSTLSPILPILLNNTTMAATTHPEVFNGNNHSIKQWFEQYEAYLTESQLTTDKEKVFRLMSFLTDTALSFYAIKIAPNYSTITWTETKDLLIRRFAIPDIAPIQLNNCQQRTIGQKHNTCQPRTKPVVAKSQVSFVVNNYRKTEPFSNDTPTTDFNSTTVERHTHRPIERLFSTAKYWPTAQHLSSKD